MDPLAFLERMRAEAPQSLAHVERISERKAESMNISLAPDLAVRLRKVGIDLLWSHQARALQELRDGRNVAIATGTASGKSLCYQLATFERLMRNPNATALYLFPTKALSQDQLRQIRAFAFPAARAAVFDGDTPSNERTMIRRNANLIITNPDMLHFGILPQSDKWSTFLRNLELIVVDEMHTLRGVFGSHVANVIRRLRRVSSERPQFACSSATIGNPSELANRLTGADFVEITEDGSPRGATYFALWNPPLVEEGENERRSTGAEASDIFAKLILNGAHTIAFGKSRKQTELLSSFARSRLESFSRPDLAGRVAAYRAGYLPEERRALEKALNEGDLLGIAATSALELGIDIGGLDACVLAGYPGTVASTFQQAGRAGRRQSQSLAIMVAQDDPLDQYIVNHPDALFGRPHESAIADHSNPNIMDLHVACAAFEKPLAPDEQMFGETLKESIERLLKAGFLKQRSGKYFYAGKDSPHRKVDLRTMGSEVRIVDQATGALIGTASSSRAPYSVHPGAIYLHQGEQFRVVSLDLDSDIALVVESDEDIYTQARDVTDIRIIASERKQPLGCTEVYFGVVEVTNQVTSFVRKRLFTGETLDVHPLDMPAMTLRTQAVWYTVPQELLDRASIDEAFVPGAAHAAEHAAIGILPLFAMCDRWDIGGVSTAMHPDTQMCTVFIYDGYPGGAGIARRAFDAASLHQRTTRDAIRDCPCESGCPACVQSPKCGNGNNPLDKLAAVRLLDALLDSK
ncbi:MAG: DEAD/DEAH box helicase [Actinomycetota bacterium]